MKDCICNLKKFMLSFIPQHISNKAVLHFLDMSGKISGIFMSRRKIEDNLKYNRMLITEKNGYAEAGRYIENQPQWKMVAFGSRRHSNMSYSGCEIIAVYNAIIALGTEMSADTMPELISHFEKHGAVFSGTFGTSPLALYRYFASENYDVWATDKSDTAKLNEIGVKYSVFLTSFYNDKYNIKSMIHTVCITKDTSGKYTAHNAYKKDCAGIYICTAAYDTFSDVLNNLGNNPKIIYTIGIRNKN
jgi:hypothetical protein